MFAARSGAPIGGLSADGALDGEQGGNALQGLQGDR